MTNPTVFGAGGHQPTSSTTFSGTYYCNVGLGRCPMETSPFRTESSVSQTIRAPGTISYLSWGVDSAFGTGLAVTLTLKLRQNGSNTNLALSIYPSTTGLITDSTHSVSVSSGDSLDFAANVPGSVTYSDSFYCISARFDATTDSAQILTAAGSTAGATPTTSLQFYNFVGVLGDNTSLAEGDYQWQNLAAGTWQNMACNIETNGFNKSTTFHNRIGGSSGTMGIAIMPFVTGSFEDTSHSDTVSAGDLLNYAFAATLSGGSGTLVLAWIGAHFLATDDTLCMIGGASNGPHEIMGTTDYSSLFGGGNLATGTTTRATGLFPYTLTASNFTSHLVDSSPGTATFTLRINGSSTLSVTSDQKAGYFTDTGSTSVSAGNNCWNEISVVGIVNWVSAGLLLQS